MPISRPPKETELIGSRDWDFEKSNYAVLLRYLFITTDQGYFSWKHFRSR